MKQVLKGQELKNIMLEAIDLMCDTVASTLGPSGNNVLINKDDESVFITNDGVTIARSIESENIAINSILEIIKEASLKTDEVVGDGTTTTLVLLQSIFKEGLKEIDKCKNPIVLKEELLKEKDNIINYIKELEQKPTKEEIKSIATISSNDVEISNLLSEVFYKMKSKYSIRIEESKIEDTYYDIKKGYSLDIDNIPSLYFNDQDKIELNDVSILVFRGYLDSLEEINLIINDFINTKKNLIIFVDDINEMIEQQLITFNLESNTNIYIFKLPDYASRKEAIVKDLSIVCNCNVKGENALFSDLGSISKCIIKKEEILIINNKNTNITKHINNLKRQLKVTYDDYEKEFLLSRIAKLEKGIATIYVGGITKTEKKERIMRFVDALCAVAVAYNGVVIGEGITFFKISQKLTNTIMKKSLKIPFQKIMINSGKDYKLLEQEILNDKIYNFTTDKLEDISNTKIIDPSNVLIEAIKNATSIAAILLTTNYLVINESLKKEIELL